MCQSLFFVEALSECFVVLRSSTEGISTSYIIIGQANTWRKAYFDINMEYKI